MNQNYSHLTILLDRSGSMSSIAKDMEGGLNTLIEEQKKQPGKCTVSFIVFDDRYEKVLDFVDVKSVGKLNLHPRGCTALRDSLAKAINETGETLRNMKEEDRPALVTMVVVSDGMENSSIEISAQALKKMIEVQQNEYSWKFNYLGTNQDSLMVAQDLGIHMQNATNYKSGKANQVFRNYSKKMSGARQLSASNMAVDMGYTKEDVEELN